MANIIGEVFDEYVNTQISARQSYLGYQYTSLNTISDDINQWLHNNSAWTRMISSVNISSKNNPESVQKRLKSLKLDNNYAGDNLAKNFILYNGVSSVTGSDNDLTFNPSTNNTSYFSNSSDFSLTNSYGFAGLDQGLRPMPGIESVRVGYINQGTLVNAEIDIIAFNKEQLNIIDTLFLHPGYTFLLEWGWTRYIDNTSGEIIHNDPSKLITTPFKLMLSPSNDRDLNQYSLLEAIKQEKINQSANYDALFLVVKNFKFTFQPNGTYKITVYAITQGDIIENLKINTVSPGTAAQGTRQQILSAEEIAKKVEELKTKLANIPTEIEELAEKVKEVKKKEREASSTVVVRSAYAYSAGKI